MFTIRDLESQKETALAPRLAYVDSLRWSPDGASFLLSGSDNKGRTGLFRLEIAGGSVTPVVFERGGDYKGFEAAWSRDGSKVYYVQVFSAGGSMIRVHDFAKGEQAELYRPGVGSRVRLLRRAWGSDSLAFVVESGDDDATQFLLALDPGDGIPRKLLHSQYGGLSGVEWETSDSHLLISTESKYGSGLWRVSVSEAEPFQLDVDWKREGSIRVSPDGRRVTFSAGESKSEVWVMEGLPGYHPAAATRP